MNNDRIKQIINEELEKRTKNLSNEEINEIFGGLAAKAAWKGIKQGGSWLSSKLAGKGAKAGAKSASGKIIADDTTILALSKITNPALKKVLGSSKDRLKLLGDLSKLSKKGGTHFLEDGSAIHILPGGAFHHVSKAAIIKLGTKAGEKISATALKNLPATLAKQFQNKSLMTLTRGGRLSGSEIKILAKELSSPKYKNVLLRVKDGITGKITNLTAKQAAVKLLKYGALGAGGVTAVVFLALVTESDSDSIRRMGYSVDGLHNKNYNGKDKSGNSVLDDIVGLGSSEESEDITNKFIKANLYDSSSDPSKRNIRYLKDGESITKQHNGETVAIYNNQSDRWQVTFNGKTRNLSRKLSNRFDAAI